MIGQKLIFRGIETMHILTCNRCIESAMLLRDKIVAKTGEHFLVTKNPDSINGKFIRYGCSAPVNVKDTKFNPANFIKLCTNKQLFSELLNSQNIYCPVFHFSSEDLIFPLLVRKTLSSFAGMGIHICKNRRQFESTWECGDAWTPFIKTAYELRVHILGGEVKKIFRKEPETGIEPQLPIRNLSNGYSFRKVRVRNFPKVGELVERLNPILVGKFYSLDLGWDSERKEYLVYEANTGSSLNTKTAEMYAKFLVKEYVNK